MSASTNLAVRIACMVAADALTEGKVVLATKILDDQVPKRLELPCGKCGSGRGDPCRRRAMTDEICAVCSGTTRVPRSALELRHVGVARAHSCAACDGTGRQLADVATEQLVPCLERLS